jgi:NADH:ubiquinone oxidoreductase subunit 4 (subunit M)
MKKIIAYSSVVHMNFALLGLFSFNIQGIVGLFLGIGVLYDRYHTRILKYFGGFNYFMPLFSIIFLILTLGNISFPGTVSFIGELLIILGFFAKNFLLTD